MEFWGIEIKPGGPVKVHVEDEYTIHVSQVTLGESSKLKDETVPVYVKVGDGKSRFVIGNLSQKIPQVSLDLMIEQDFELSHNCKTSSVYLLGCKIFEDEHNSDSDSDSEEEDIYMDNELANAPAPVSNDQKAIEAAESDSDEEDESDSDDEMDSDEDEDDDDSEEEVEEDKAPLKVEPPSKKQPNGGAMKQKAKHGPGCCVPPKAGRQ